MCLNIVKLLFYVGLLLTTSLDDVQWVTLNSSNCETFIAEMEYTVSNMEKKVAKLKFHKGFDFFKNIVALNRTLSAFTLRLLDLTNKKDDDDFYSNLEIYHTFLQKLGELYNRLESIDVVSFCRYNTKLKTYLICLRSNTSTVLSLANKLKTENDEVVEDDNNKLMKTVAASLSENPQLKKKRKIVKKYNNKLKKTVAASLSENPELDRAFSLTHSKVDPQLQSRQPTDFPQMNAKPTLTYSNVGLRMSVLPAPTYSRFDSQLQYGEGSENNSSHTIFVLASSDVNSQLQFEQLPSEIIQQQYPQSYILAGRQHFSSTDGPVFNPTVSVLLRHPYNSGNDETSELPIHFNNC